MNVSEEEKKIWRQQDARFDEFLGRIGQSTFRNSFHLKEKDIAYIDDKGWDKIKSHCKDFIHKNEGRANNPRDVKQTPTKGHPVFIAQHATASCCRGCIRKWHKIPENRDLSPEEEKYLVTLIMAWIHKEYLHFKSKDAGQVKSQSAKKIEEKKDDQLSIFDFMNSKN